MATTTTITTFAFRDLDEQDDLGVVSAGIEYELNPTERSGLVLGVGQSWLDLAGGSDSGTSFLVGGYVDPCPGTRLRGSVARKIRFPSIRQLYEPGTGNPDLEAERSHAFELGVEQELPRATRLALTGFQLELRDFIERIGGEPFENRERLRMRGFEVTATSQPLAPLFVRVGYTFLDARDVAGGSPFDELQSRPRHKLDAEARYRLPWGTLARAALSYVADAFVYTRNEPFAQMVLDDFVLIDLRVSQPLLGERVHLFAGVDNLLDEEWDLNYGFPQPGRTLYGGIELRFF
jgi:outer membrane cobalamin receptor